MKQTHLQKAAATALSLLMVLAVFSGCSSQESGPQLSARDLTAGVPRGSAAVDYDFTKQTEPPQSYEKFSEAVAEFSASLLRETGKEGQNRCSPLFLPILRLLCCKTARRAVRSRK